MGSKSQRKKEQMAQKRNEKRKRQLEAQKRLAARGRVRSTPGGQRGYNPLAEIPLPSNLRHRERLAQSVPHAWPGELPEDTAVFDNTALASLPTESATQAQAVREALQAALESRGDEAQKCVASIPRGSSFSDWRLFIRGLVEWLAGDSTAASDAWKRLDAERRPGRIATTMMLALRTDLEQATPPQAQPETAPSDCFDAAQLYHARLLRRVRFDRPALKIAETGANHPEEEKRLILGPRKIDWVARFVGEYQDTEPALAAALAQTALRRAYNQNFSNLFDEAVRKIPGPKHDPCNRLLTFFYYCKFTRDNVAEQKADRALEDYLKRELPQNKSLTAELRGAIASYIHLREAQDLMAPAEVSMFRFLEPEEDSKAVRNHLLAAAIASPGHAAVYQAHVSWINSKLENDRLSKAEETKFEKELAEVMSKWAQGAPHDPEPRLWLVDHLLEEEKLEEARPHVDFLAASRQEIPLVRATPWKWQLLEAMRLCRRKAWLPEVPARLAEVEKQWPGWLPKQWLPYLSAALVLRSGQLDAFEICRQRICTESGLARDSLADACLMLGAAQRMRATSQELKPLRAAVDQNLKKIDELPLEDLLATGSFFWDLHRARLLYPAYRLQGKTIGKALLARLQTDGKELLARLDKDSPRVLELLPDERLQKSMLWGAEYRYWSNGYETKVPAFFAQLEFKQYPIYAAAKLHAFLHQTYWWGADKYAQLGPILRAAAASEPDAYYRHWYVDLANRLDDALAEQKKRMSRSPLGNLFGFADDEDDDEDDDYDYDEAVDFDPDCDCPECMAARKAYKSAKASQAKSH